MIKQPIKLAHDLFCHIQIYVSNDSSTKTRAQYSKTIDTQIILTQYHEH